MDLRDFRNKNERNFALLQTILPLLDANLVKSDRVAMQKEIALQLGVSYRTVGRYVDAYKKNGINAFEKEKQTRDWQRTISEEIVQQAIILRRENPVRSVKDIIWIMEKEGLIDPKSVKRSTLQRYFTNKGFSKKQMIQYAPLKEGATARRFQKEHRMELVQGDVKYGPYIDGKRTYFIGWIDDCTRFITYGRFYYSEGAEDILKALKESIKRCGKPKRLYLDNGSGYISKQLKDVCMELGIIITHTKPRSPAAKGKIEKFNGLMEKFITECSLTTFYSIEELNAIYTAWESERYLHETHSSLQHKTPYDTFINDTTELKLVDDQTLEQAFSIHTDIRKVSKIGTISFRNQDWQVNNMNLIGLKVKITWYGDNPVELKVTKKGYEDATAKLIVISSNVDFSARTEIINAKSILPATESRMFNAARASYEERYPGTKLFEQSQPQVEQPKQASILSYRSLQQEEDK